MSSQGYEQLVEVANPNDLRNYYGRTALDAMQEDRPDILERMLRVNMLSVNWCIKENTESYLDLPPRDRDIIAAVAEAIVDDSRGSHE